MAKRKSRTVTFDATESKASEAKAAAIPEKIECNFEPTGPQKEPTIQVNFRMTRKEVEGLNILTALGGFRTKGHLLDAMTRVWVRQKGAEIPAEIKKKYGF